jgi:large subunit ribosomal protein L9
MRLLLRRTVEHVGKIGDIVNVSDGYGRNYLMPQGLGVAVTADNRKMIEIEKVKVAKIEAEKKAKMETLARTLHGAEMELLEKAQDDDTLYGSVTGHSIAQTLNTRLNLELDPKSVKLVDPIKKLGVYDVEIKLHAEVSAKIRIYVNREPD